MIRKIATPLPKASARAVVDSYTMWCIDTTPADFSAAFRIEDEARIGFWSVRIENPFSGGVEIA